MLLFLFGACTVFQPLDGTWLFRIDPDSTQSGDCASDDSAGDQVESIGTSDIWVDIYTVSGGEIAIIWDPPLLGTLTGSAVEASYETGYTYKKRSETHTTTFEATLSGGSMEGTLSSTYAESNDGDKYTCTTKNELTATRAVSSPDSFAGN